MRLHRYWREPNEEMWDDIWEHTPNRDYWGNALQGGLASVYKQMFLRYLPAGAKVLEAGCGVGHVVLASREGRAREEQEPCGATHHDGYLQPSDFLATIRGE